jgi:predicted  nucleic acid-binding Zn-ribbon protein
LENSKRDNRELERKVKDLQERLNTANASIRTYRNEEGRLKRDLQAAERRVDTEQAGLRRELTLKEQQFDSKVAQHAREMGHKDSLIQRHMATIGDRDEQIAKMKKEAEELRKRLKEHEDEKVKMTKNQKELEGEKASLETTIISLRVHIHIHTVCFSIQIYSDLMHLTCTCEFNVKLYIKNRTTGMHINCMYLLVILLSLHILNAWVCIRTYTVYTVCMYSSTLYCMLSITYMYCFT